ncbi:MAG: branched-chain amino acid aminotransferase [Alphaproteobacteria bacterium]|nr:branched-chain amino acid aminotransferase [Alphaproteobacteria bacterium]MDE2043219.1 branched-chain amino acid aminotransferase [Alphaproteobacteria bacterium]MDE2341079.1 branched-chain amino acid aminotransferase [Alphaproteobacteria bacterium]
MIASVPHPHPTPADARARLIANPGFGTVFTDHMIDIRYTEGKGWHDERLVARAPLTLDPAAAVLHYAQEIFEGMKAYRLADGGFGLFRPDANAARFNQSAQRMAMPALPEDLFVEAVETLVRADAAWFPPMDGGVLYLRPFMFASEAFLGVRPAREYRFMVIASAVGAYFKAGGGALSLWVSEHYTRAARGGTGAAKCGGNYAGSLIAQAEAIEKGHDQVVFLDAVENRWIEELGGMNIFFVFADGSLQTPPLGGTILPGITRDALMTLAHDAGMTVREAPYALDQWRADAHSGKLVECFACGTAAVVTPIGKVAAESGDFTIGAGALGQLTQKLRQQLVGIQHGVAPDPHNWLHRIR